MYSIFGTKKKTQSYLQEGEPPPKKLVSEGDLLIKELSKNQLKTNTTLSQELQHEKVFATNKESFTDITTYFKGPSTLQDFQSKAAVLHQENKYRSLGLSDQEIEMFRAYSHMNKQEFFEKYSNINRDVLTASLQHILALVAQAVSSSTPVSNSTDLSRHDNEYFSSLKPQSAETKLLKFATQNQVKTERFEQALSILPDLTKKLTSNLEEYSNIQTKGRLKKIRRKARALGQDIAQLTSESSDVLIGPRPGPNDQVVSDKTTLWDMSEKPGKNDSLIERTIGCKPQKLFTIKNGSIVEHYNTVEKLTVEEIMNIPRFADYSAEAPSKKLFVKNLRRGVKEQFLRDILQKHFPNSCFTVKVMSGKMRGQAFIEFNDEVAAARALDILNGVLDHGRPIIVQFSKTKMTPNESEF